MMRNDHYPSGGVPITVGTTTGNFCGILAGAAGTATVTDTHGNTVTLTLAAGIPVMIGFVTVTAATATGLVGFIP